MAKIISNSECDGVTHTSISFFEEYKDAFGKVVSAKMVGNVKHCKYALILINDKGEEMHFDGGLTSGYRGEGSRGTYKVLKECGFEINETFVFENESFNLSLD